MGSYANLADFQPWALEIGVQISYSPILLAVEAPKLGLGKVIYISR